jgi:hypothetical protein
MAVTWGIGNYKTENTLISEELCSRITGDLFIELKISKNEKADHLWYRQLLPKLIYFFEGICPRISLFLYNHPWTLSIHSSLRSLFPQHNTTTSEYNNQSQILIAENGINENQSPPQITTFTATYSHNPKRWRRNASHGERRCRRRNPIPIARGSSHQIFPSSWGTHTLSLLSPLSQLTD